MRPCSMFLRMNRDCTVELTKSRFINKDTLMSLGIMQSESHPSSHNQGPTTSSSGSKEGLSVYGLFHHLTSSPQGRMLLQKRILHPSTNLAVIRERLDAVSTFVRSDNIHLAAKLSKSLRAVQDMRRTTVSLRMGVSTGSGRAGAIANRIWIGLQNVWFPINAQFACGIDTVSDSVASSRFIHRSYLKQCRS